MQERNRPYTSTFWQILRGAELPERLRTLFYKKHCCGVGGMEVKVSKAVANEMGGAGEKECFDGLVGIGADARIRMYLVDHFYGHFNYLN